MTHYKIFGILIGLIILFSVSCSQFGNGPDQESTGFKFQIKYGEIVGEKLGINSQSGSAQIPKALNMNSVPYNISRVIALGYPEYESWSDVVQDSNWFAFTNERDNVIPSDSLDYYSQWEKLLGKYFTIMDNDTLDIENGYATGNVKGAQGLNRFLVTFNKDDYIIYWGEGVGYGTLGSLTNVEITVYQQNSIPGDTTITGLTVVPDSSQVFPGDSLQLYCIASLPNGSIDTVNTQATWSLSPGTRGQISQGGMFTADNNNFGFETISAQYEGWSAVAVAEVSNMIYSEDFESYNDGDYPAQWSVKYNGVSGAVSDEKARFGTKSFKQVAQVTWGRRDVLNIPSVDKLSYSLYILLADAGKGTNIGLYQDVAPWGEMYAYIHFAKDQSIAMLDAGSGIRINTTSTWQPNQWYYVYVTVDYQTQTMNVSIDNSTIVQDMAIGKKEYTGFSLGYVDLPSGTGTFYYDNILIQVQ